jgi:hypothetical protein
VRAEFLSFGAFFLANSRWGDVIDVRECALAGLNM